MRITVKGQVTIPQEIRERLGLLPHCEVEFDIVGNSVRMRKKAGSKYCARSGRSPGAAPAIPAAAPCGRPNVGTDRVLGGLEHMPTRGVCWSKRAG